MTAELPALETLPEPAKFTGVFDELAVVEKKNTRIGRGYWQHEEQACDTLELAADLLTSAVEGISTDKKWVLDCMQLGCASHKDPSLRRPWDALLELVDSCALEIPAREELILAYGPKLTSDQNDRALLKICNQIIAKISVTKKRDLKARNVLFKPAWKEFLQQAQVDDGEPKKLDHFKAICNLLETRSLRERLLRYWDERMGDYDEVSGTELGSRPERTAHKLSVEIRNALNWYEERWKPCESVLQDLGFDEQLQWQLAKDTRGYSRMQEWVKEEMQPVFRARIDFVRHRELVRISTQWTNFFDGYSKRDVIYPLIRQFRKAVKGRDYDSYLRAWHQLQDFIQMRPDYEKRETYLGQIESVAENWALALRQHKAPHDQDTPPGNIMDAWRFRQFDQILTGMGDNDLDKLQHDLSGILDKLQDVTGQYVEKLSWLSQVERTGLKQQQALNGWLELQKKMGRGKGKQVARLKQEAKMTLLECRQAVPVWIMPTAQVFESFDLATTRFDVVIIDEASQSDLRGLGILALGREVVVVGDHEQVSPYGIGQQTDKIQELIDEHLDHIPNKQIYDGRTSIYDLAKQSFGGTIRLVEHFRCVPDIIQFSNHLCYNGEIQALRESSTSKISPALIVHHVPEGLAVDKINRPEGEEIASLIVSLCRFPEYEKCTLGVISMVGVEQARFIDSILRRRLSVSEYEKRRILCGNASQFQGDERDVIFLSLVDSPRAKALPRRQSSEVRKVYNVAASRAKDQLWVVHSLDMERDLKEGDLRLRLLKHANDPSGLRRRTTQDKVQFKSEFHKAVYRDLKARDYHVTSFYELGHHVMDLVVEGRNGKRLAIQCDGDYERPSEQIPIEVERQLTLERLDWKMVRLRVSEYFLNSEQIMKKLVATLDRAQIEPVPITTVEPVAVNNCDELQTNVIKKARSIRIRWKPMAEEPEDALQAKG